MGLMKGIYCAAFIGQASGKKDAKTGAKSKGQTQKEQVNKINMNIACDIYMYIAYRREKRTAGADV